jgi:hypothetical protein
VGIVTTEPVDFSSIMQQLAEIDSWLRTRGISPQGRIQRYAKNILEMKRSHHELNDARVIYEQMERSGRLTEILSSYVEAIEFVTTINNLRAKGVHIPESILKKILAGPADAATEDADSNAPRNFMFELVIAAFLARHGFTPQLEVEPDIAVDFEDKQILIACKRVLSEAKIEQRIRDAARQIREHSAADNHVGLIAISVTRLIYTGEQLWQVESVDAIEPFLQYKTNEIISQRQRALSFLDRSGILGVIFYLSTPIYVLNKGFTPVSYRMVFPTEPTKDLLGRFMARFRD